MPTKRTRRTHKRSVVGDAVWYLLSDGLIKLPANTDVERARIHAFEFEFVFRNEDRRRVWQECKAAVLREYARHRPGTRPVAWWKYDAPEPARRRLGGVGDSAARYSAVTESLEHGLPRYFVSEFAEAQGHTRGKAIDPEDPPRYESEAAYLERHGLLTPVERKALGPQDFEPEVVVDSPAVQERVIGHADRTKDDWRQALEG